MSSVEAAAAVVIDVSVVVPAIDVIVVVPTIEVIVVVAGDVVTAVVDVISFDGIDDASTDVVKFVTL